MDEKIKLLVWDLDETLWNGIFLHSNNLTLKEGVKGIIETLDKHGILQSVISKNPQDVEKKIRDFGLEEYFVFPQLNWSWKPVNMAEIMSKIHVLSKNVAFIDDNELEREAMKSRFPEILCLDAGDYLKILDNPRFTPQSKTKESESRRLFFKAEERRRTELPPEDFLHKLDMRAYVREAETDDLPRVFELYNRTNMMNATGVRFSRECVKGYLSSPNKKIIIVSAEDKYGSYGLIGVAFLNDTTVEGLAVSCRVIDRGILPSFLSTIGRNSVLKIKAKKTKYNDIFLEQLRKGGLKPVGDYWIAEGELKCPEWVSVHVGL